MPFHPIFLFLTLIFFFSIASCGKKGDPLPPETGINRGYAKAALPTGDGHD